MDSKIYCTDPLGNKVGFDKDSLGIAILHNETRSLAHINLKKSLENPMSIVEISDETRLYCFGKIGAGVSLFVANVILVNAEWYVNECTYWHEQNRILELLTKNKILFSR